MFRAAFFLCLCIYVPTFYPAQGLYINKKRDASNSGEDVLYNRWRKIKRDSTSQLIKPTMDTKNHLIPWEILPKEDPQMKRFVTRTPTYSFDRVTRSTRNPRGDQETDYLLQNIWRKTKKRNGLNLIEAPRLIQFRTLTDELLDSAFDQDAGYTAAPNLNNLNVNNKRSSSVEDKLALTRYLLFKQYM